jgi:predicted nucleic acid-binding protein
MSKSLVVDAGLTISLILPGPHQGQVKKLMTYWKQGGHTLYAPTLWLYEVSSTLRKSVRFGLLTPVEGEKALHLAQKLDIQLIHPDVNLTQQAFKWTLRLKHTSAYDCFYLALAETLPAKFWTTNKRLHEAANVSWVHYVGDLTK